MDKVTLGRKAYYYTKNISHLRQVDDSVSPPFTHGNTMFPPMKHFVSAGETTCEVNLSVVSNFLDSLHRRPAFLFFSSLYAIGIAIGQSKANLL
jgi:hypothetical protein